MCLSSSAAFTCLHNLHLSLSLYICQEREQTHTHIPTHWHTFAGLCICIVSDKDSAGGQRVQCNLKRNNHTQRGTTRNARREKRTGPVALEPSSSAAATSTPSSSAPPPPSSLSSSILPSLLSFHYFSSYIKKKELGLPYTTRIRIYITASICLLQLTVA